MRAAAIQALIGQDDRCVLFRQPRENVLDKRVSGKLDLFARCHVFAGNDASGNFIFRSGIDIRDAQLICIAHLALNFVLA